MLSRFDIKILQASRRLKQICLKNIDILYVYGNHTSSEILALLITSVFQQPIKVTQILCQGPFTIHTKLQRFFYKADKKIAAHIKRLKKILANFSVYGG